MELATDPMHVLAFAALFIVAAGRTTRPHPHRQSRKTRLMSLELTMIHEAMLLEYSGLLLGADGVGAPPSNSSC